MNAQKYNGWYNRETWCVNLHGFTDNVSSRWIHDMFEADGRLCGTYFNWRLDRHLTWSEVSSEFKSEFMDELENEIYSDVEHYLEEVVHLDNIFVQDIMPDMRPHWKGGCVNYEELAEHIFEEIKQYAEHNGWS